MVRFLSLLLFSCLSYTSLADPSRYTMGAGDLVSISIYHEADLSLDVRIGPSGQISYPLLGDIIVSGLSPKELETKLTQGLKGPYLIDPSVTVFIIEYRPFYVTGEVKKPGSYAFHPGLTVDKAISISGGFTERASKGSIFVEHDERDDSTEKKQSVELNDVIQPGDVITVEQSFF
jgi:polysaccharide export outer membrane protein